MSIYMDPYREWEPMGSDVLREAPVQAGWRVVRDRVKGLPMAAAIWSGNSDCIDLIDMLASAYLQGVYDASRIDWAKP